MSESLARCFRPSRKRWRMTYQAMARLRRAYFGAFR